MAQSQKGIDVRQTGTALTFRAFLQTSAGARLGTGTTTLELLEIQSDGTVKSYDFNDNTFKTTALTTPTLALTHRPSNNATTTTGLWTVVLGTVSGFTVGGIYIAIVKNTGASPEDQAREFQYGSEQGDVVPLSVDSAARLERAVRAITLGTVTTGASTTSIPTSGLDPAASVTDQFKGLILEFDAATTTANLRGQKTDITSSTAGGTLTVTALTTAPVSGDTFTIN